MKNLKFQPLIWAGVLLTANACNLDEEIIPSESANTFASIKSPKGFNWNTTKEIEVNFEGLTSDTRLGILRIATLNGDVIFQKLQEGNENYQLKVTIPAHVQQLAVSFAGIEKTFDTIDRKIIINIQ